MELSISTTNSYETCGCGQWSSNTVIIFNPVTIDRLIFIDQLLAFKDRGSGDSPHQTFTEHEPVQPDCKTSEQGNHQRAEPSGLEAQRLAQVLFRVSRTGDPAALVSGPPGFLLPARQ